MKTSRGRFSQYKILLDEKKLSKHLVETVLFTKESLFAFLEKYKTVVLRPSFGTGDFIISLENNKYKIKSQGKIVIVNNMEEMYEYINLYEIKQNYYIVQAQKLTSSIFQTPYRSFVTIHRMSSTAKWQIISITDNNNYSLLRKFFQKYLLQKMRSISILAAEKLGRSFPSCNTIVIEIMSDFTKGMYIYDTRLHFSNSKWDQYQTLRTSSTILPYVPETDLLTHASFSDFLKRFKDIIIKPCIGQHGIGVVQIKRNDSFSYEIHYGIKKITKPNLEDAYSYIKETFLSKKVYIVQQRVQLATIHDCPIDLRVITQKVDSTWSVTGKMVKVAGENFIITNAAQKLLTLEKAIQESTISHKNNEIFEDELEEICISAAKKLDEKNIELSIIGFDVGITDQGDIWIIEGNYIPDLTMFKELEDQQVYMNMLEIKKLNFKTLHSLNKLKKYE